MGLKLAALGAAAALAVGPADYLVARQQPDGGFAEPGGHSDPALTAWAVLGLRAAGRQPARSPNDYLHEAVIHDTTDLALRVLALRSLGDVRGLDLQLQRRRRADGRIGSLVNSTAWSALALGKPGRATIRYLLRAQHRSGGWSWAPNGGVRLVPGHEPDTQSTAWAIQAYLAAGVRPPGAAYRFLRSLRRPDGSYRYSRRYAVTPAIVTAQVLPALARKPFPLR